MKSRFLLLLLLLILLLPLAAAPATAAAIIYSGIQNVPIPLDPVGAYLRFDTGATAVAYPADWDTAPWINPDFGGARIFNSPLLRPVITGTAQVLNLVAGTVIGGASNFVAGESGSDTHFGIGPGQFALNVPGYLGVAFRPTVGGPDSYGWIQMQISNTGAGKIIAWAYEVTPGTSIQAGATGVVPEPGTALLGLAGGAALGLWRRRRVGS